MHSPGKFTACTLLIIPKEVAEYNQDLYTPCVFLRVHLCGEKHIIHSDWGSFWPCGQVLMFCSLKLSKTWKIAKQNSLPHKEIGKIFYVCTQYLCLSVCTQKILPQHVLPSFDNGLKCKTFTTRGPALMCMTTGELWLVQSYMHSLPLNERHCNNVLSICSCGRTLCVKWRN